jgi:hypothetical protein
MEQPFRQRFLVHGIAGGKGASSKDARDGAEGRRLVEAIEALPDARDRERAWLAELEAADKLRASA